MKLIIKNEDYNYEEEIKDKKDMIEALKLGVSSFVPYNYDGDGVIKLRNNDFNGLVRMLDRFHPDLTSWYFNYGRVTEEIVEIDKKVRANAKEIFLLLDKVNNYESVNDIVKELDNFNKLFKESGVDASYKIE